LKREVRRDFIPLESHWFGLACQKLRACFFFQFGDTNKQTARRTLDGDFIQNHRRKSILFFRREFGKSLHSLSQQFGHKPILA